MGRIVDAIAERCRSRPLLLIVDDAEWSTGPVVDVLRAVAIAADQMALLVVLVVDPSAGGPAVTALGRLDPTGAATIAIEPMSDDELAAVLFADGVDPSAVPAIVAMSNGLPGIARREGAIWAERTASERLRAAAVSSIGASAIAQRAHTSVLDEVIELVDARARRDELWSARWAGRQPYRALSAYGPQDAELFVGRERLVAELAARVLERRLVVVVGASGSGKSSLLRAGLVPLARSGRLPGSVPWSTHVVVPGFDPLASLEAIDELDEPGPQLLVVDQFEEAFAASAPTLERFAGQLLDLAEDPDLDVHVVLVVRADEYDKLAGLPLLGQPASHAPVVVGPPTDDEIRRIVAEPARRTGTAVEPALVDLVAGDVGGYEAALPLVSAAMAEVWEQRDAGVMRCARYLELGGLATVVERLGEQALAAAGDEHIDAVSRILLLLADITDDGVWTRRRVTVDELPQDAAALDSLVASRLVVRTGETVEIIHEIVFRAWPQLAAWLEEARADLIIERELRSAARSWDTAGRPEDHLYRGIRLQAALEWADRSDAATSAVLTEFLVSGRQLGERHEHEIRDQLRRERRARRRATRALGVAAVLLVSALVAGGVAAISRNRAMDAERRAVAAKDAADAERAIADTERSTADAARATADAARATADDARANADVERTNADDARQVAGAQRDAARISRLVAESERLLPSQLDLAGLLAVEARRRTDTPDTRGALLTALGYTMPASTKATIPSRFLGYLQPPVSIGDGGVALDLSDDGTVLASASWTPLASQLTVYDVRDHHVLATAELPLLLQDVDLSADGTRAVGLIEHLRGDPTPPDRLVVLDVDSGATTFVDLPQTAADEASAPRVRLTPDGSHAVVLQSDGALTAWDLASGTHADLPLPHEPFDWFDVTPDGTLATFGDGTVTWSDLTTGATMRRQVVDEGGTDFSHALYALSPDGRTLAIGVWQGPVLLADLTTGALIPDVGGRPVNVRSVTFDPADPNVLAITTTVGDVAFFDVSANSAIGQPTRVHGNGMRDVSFSASGATMAAFADDRRISLWGDGRSPGLIDAPLVEDPDLVHAVYSPNGKDLLLFGSDHVEVRDAHDPAVPGTPITHAETDAEPDYYLARFDGDGSRVLLGTGTDEISDFVVDLPSGAEVWSAPSGTIARDISPDGATALVERNRHTLELWDVDADRPLATLDLADIGLEGNFMTFLTFSPDGKFVDAVTDTGAVRLAVPSLAPGTVFSVGRAQCTAAYVPGTDLLATMDGPGRVSLLDMAGGTVARTGTSRDSTSICGVAVSTDGSVVAAHQFFTRQVALFDTASMQPIGTPIPVGDGGGVLTPAFADPTHLVDVAAAGGLASYDLDPDTWQANVCQQVGRNLTAAEWDEYLSPDEPYRATCPQWPAGE